MAPEPDGDDRFRRLFTAIDEGYCLCEIVLDEDGRPVDYLFLEVNPQFERMTGLVDAVGRAARSLVPGLEQEWIDTYARAALHGERVRFQQLSEAMGRYFDVFAMPMDRTGRFAVVFKDDTLRHQTEMSLRTSEVALRDAVAREHADSLHLQQALLPSTIVDHPDLPIRAEYLAVGAGDDVGGDWYDTFSWPDGEIGIMVGDVVGHNLAAAVQMGTLRSGVAALARRVGPDPVGLMEALEECVVAPDGAEFVTAVVVVIDPADGALTYCSAGHPPSAVVDRLGTVAWLDEVQTPPLFPGPQRTRRSGTVELLEGSTLVMYSDGLIEREGEVIDVGLDRLRRAASAAASAPFDEAGPGILAAALDGHVPADDIVVVTARLGSDHRGKVSRRRRRLERTRVLTR